MPRQYWYTGTHRQRYYGTITTRGCPSGWGAEEEQKNPGTSGVLSHGDDFHKKEGLFAILTPKSNTDLRSENWQKLHVQNGMQKSEFSWDRNTLTLQGLRPVAVEAPVAIVLYYLYRDLGNSEVSHAPPPPMGAGLAQGGLMIA